MPMVLGLVSFRIFPTLMGGQRGVALFYHYLKLYTGVSLAVSSDNQNQADIPAHLVLFPNKRIYLNLFRIKKLEKIVRQEKIELILAEHSYAGWMAWLLHKKTGKPFIVHSHNIESKRFRQMHKWWWKLYHSYEGWIHRKAHHNFFISREDQDFAIEAFRLEPGSCSVITYGVEEKKIKGDKARLKNSIGIPAEQTMLLFNGTLDYKPNRDAVERIIDSIEPLLQKKISDFVIVITGNRAPDDLINKMNSASHLQFHGYVDDPDLYYQAADLFINPVSNDSGVKTKVIEAIANHCSTVSTKSGASGIEVELCRNKIFTVPDGNFELFTDCITETLKIPGGETPKLFFEAYNWKNITAKAAEKIRELSSR